MSTGQKEGLKEVGLCETRKFLVFGFEYYETVEYCEFSIMQPARTTECGY